MTSTLCLLVPVLVIAIVLDIFLVTGLHRLQTLRKKNLVNGSIMSKRDLWKHSFFPPAHEMDWGNTFLNDPNFRRRFGILIELTLLAVWAIMLGSDFLDMNPRMIPGGNEFGSAIQSHHLWTKIQSCGLCALWNGSERGGFPAFADVQGSMLHPLVAITTLIWGVVNGVKISLIVALWSAGVAQWWLARELKLSWVPRIWSAGIAIAGGHLSGRMELGVFGVTLATAMGSLVFAAILHVENQRTNRSAVLLGITGALAILSGQGYMQVGLIGILPAMLFLIIEKGRRLASHWINYALASFLGLLLAAPLLIPLVHFSGNIVKDTDPAFTSAQPLRYFILNLVIDDANFFRSAYLGKFPYPYLYSLFIGWVPVLLAIYGITKVKREHWRTFGFLFTGIALAFLIASAVILKPLASIFPSIAGIRHSPQIAGLAIPLILALSAYGLEQLLNLRWPDLYMSFTKPGKKQYSNLSSRWILLIPLVLSLKSSFDYSKLWLYTVHRDEGIYEILAILKTEQLQWVEPPFGEHAFIEPALSMGLKLSPGIMTWSWHRHEYPPAYRTVSREGTPPGNVELLGDINGLMVYKNADAEYASIQTVEENYPCSAYGSDGDIRVICDSDTSGSLVLKEYKWTGWYVWKDEKPTSLEFDETWLKVHAPAGKHTFIFRYLPWDVPLGVTLWICGLIACIFFWKQKANKQREAK